tara:strand:- start:195 stop:503 length:309 start_codon:yes stop_codon:yes gene_type:complete
MERKSVDICMEGADSHYKAYKEGIMRASLIRKDLSAHPTEYFPEKVRGLNEAYILTVKEIIRQGELFLDKTDRLMLGLKVASTIENYRALLSFLDKLEGEQK